MKHQNKSTVRKGSVSHMTLDGTDYALFIWQNGKHFCGRVEGQPQMSEQSGSTALAVHKALCSLITANQQK